MRGIATEHVRHVPGRVYPFSPVSYFRLNGALPPIRMTEGQVIAYVKRYRNAFLVQDAAPELDASTQRLLLVGFVDTCAAYVCICHMRGVCHMRRICSI